MIHTINTAVMKIINVIEDPACLRKFPSGFKGWGYLGSI